MSYYVFASNFRRTDLQAAVTAVLATGMRAKTAQSRLQGFATLHGLVDDGKLVRPHGRLAATPAIGLI